MLFLQIQGTVYATMLFISMRGIGTKYKKSGEKDEGKEHRKKRWDRKDFSGIEIFLPVRLTTASLLPLGKISYCWR